MITRIDVERALLGTRAFARAQLSTGVAIAVRRLAEPERDRELTRAALEAGPDASEAHVERARARRLVWAAVYDPATVDADAPERFFASAAEVGDLDEALVAELVALVAAQQGSSLRFSDDRQKNERELAAALASWGELDRLRADRASDLCAFYGARSSLELTDEQVLLWARLSTLPADKSARVEEPEAPSPRRLARPRLRPR